VNEIQRLKTEGVLGRKKIYSPTKGDLAPSCKGTMTINEVAIQLKREFLARAMKGETVYHFIALVKYRNYLDASSLVSLGNGINSSHLHAGVLHFPNSFTIPNLEPDFKVTVEIFVLETLREYLPHEAKYHIKREKNKMTPKKHKGDSQSKFTHFQHSPAGPNAVQASKFKSIGNLSIDITTLQRCHWQFERVSSTSPLEGNVSMKIQCSAEGGVEERGFLTMFQDISGYGDWHRRWCKLTSSELSYWMYPEDESNEPLGRIALRHCVTSRVGPVPRDVCARANTFLLVTTRSPHPGDKDTLVTSCHGEYTAVRHLISADTREERDLWCRQFNRSLANLRAWDPHAHSPDDALF
jgi:actin-binding protein anillin